MKLWLKLALLISVLLAILIGLAAPPVLKANAPARHARGVNYLKRAALVLSAFEHGYGHLPQEKIPDDLLKHYPQLDRNDSNYLLGQIIYSKRDSSIQSGHLKDSIPMLDHVPLLSWGEGTIWGDTQPKIHYPLPYPYKSVPSNSKGFRLQRWHLGLACSLLATLIYVLKKRKQTAS